MAAESVYAGDASQPVYLISFPAIDSAVVSFTPFGGKTEMILRIAGIEYEGLRGNPTDKTQAPKGKFPTLKHGNRLIADSSLIYQYLCETFPDKMKAFTQPTPDLNAQALALQRMVEESLYFCGLFFNWQCDDGWAVIGPRAFADVPWFIRWYVAPTVRKSVIRDLHGQGMGRHSVEHVKERAAEELAALEQLLGSQQFLLGDVPCQADCFLFGLLEASVTNYVGGEASSSNNFIAAELKKHARLQAFHNRLRTEYFPEAENGSCKHWKRCPGNL